jgi:(2R)-ethylmalonyl-CoA mutase
LVAGDSSESILVVDPDAERKQIEGLNAFRSRRNAAEVEQALKALADAARSGTNIMPASIRAAHAGVTTGEWAQTLRQVFGEYRAPTGLQGATFTGEGEQLAEVRSRAKAVSQKLGHPIRLLVAKPGLDGHSNGAEQIAVRAKEAGLEVIYDGIRLTPEQIVESALQEDVDAIGLSIHSGSHMTLIPRVTELLGQRGLADVPVFVGGIVPHADHARLKAQGVARIYTPGEATLTQIIRDIIDTVDAARAQAGAA